MQSNAQYNALLENIKLWEQQLTSLEEKTKLNEQKIETAEKDIEDHFAKCVNTLAARRDTLLEELGAKRDYQKKQVEDKQNEVSKAIEMRRRILDTGAFIFGTDAKTAEQIWQGATNLPEPQTAGVQIAVDLPVSLLQSIHEHGTVIMISEERAEAKTEEYFAEEVIAFAGSEPGNKDGQGLAAKFNSLREICWNAYDQCFYICDKNNNAIRKMTLEGTVSTFVDGLNGPNGIVLHHSAKTFFVTNQNAHSIVKVSFAGKVEVLAGGTPGYKDGVGVKARFKYPNGIAIDQKTGNLFVSDHCNHVIRQITPQGKVFTLAGANQAFCLDGVGTIARFSYPYGILFDDIEQSLLVCDSHNHKLRRVSLNGEVATVCNVPEPTHIIIVNNSFLVATGSHNKLFQITRQGRVSELTFKNGQDGKTRDLGLIRPCGLVFHSPSHSCLVTEDEPSIVKQITLE